MEQEVKSIIRISDYGVVAFLRYHKQPEVLPPKYSPHDSLVYFNFEDSEQVRRLIADYFTESLPVNPFTYSNILKVVRRLVLTLIPRKGVE